MIFDNSSPQRAYFVPEVVQTSAMDCGPATLKSILQGFGLSISYGRLREACRTDVDGTSIDTMEEIAVQLGFDATQIMAPIDHVLLDEARALPAIAVVRQPNGLTHFVVVWRAHKHIVQIMDPATGRMFWTRDRLVRELYVHRYPVDEQTAYHWLSSEDFTAPLDARLRQLSIEPSAATSMIQAAVDREHWHDLAALDAATRLTGVIVRAGDKSVRAQAHTILDHFYRTSRDESVDIASSAIPERYWSIVCESQPSPSDAGESVVYLRGAVLMNITGRRPLDDADDMASTHPDGPVSEIAAAETPGQPVHESIPRHLRAAVDEREIRPIQHIAGLLRREGWVTLTIVAVALILATAAVSLEAILLRGLMSLDRVMQILGPSLDLTTGLFAFFIVLLALEMPMVAMITYLGRWMEIRIRIALLEKIPKLGDRYFHSRLTSDMAQRAHDLRSVRKLPELATSGFKTTFEFLLTSVGLIWLHPAGAWLVVTASSAILVLAFITQPILRERDLRFRTHIGALTRFYLDALLGLTPIRTHRAERSLQTEHEALLVKWSDAGVSFYRVHVLILGVAMVTSNGLAIWLLFDYVAHGGAAAGVILLLYWALKLPLLAQTLMDSIQQYQMNNNRIIRILEMLTSTDESDEWYHASDDADEPTGPSINTRRSQDADTPPGVAIDISDVSVHIGGQTVLRDIDVSIAPGEHVAVVGASGAGKSSLAGLLLGWYRPISGQVRADGALVHAERLRRLRRETAWIDPGVQLWNRSLDENLRYGSDHSSSTALREAIQAADLHQVADRLPEGAATALGEGGGLVSGGEGQRVRLGRGLYRRNVRLAILDEPFRGLDRDRRRQLLTRSRDRFRDATLLFISHDIADTMSFDRVLVIHEGRIVEDGHPNALVADQKSRYFALKRADDAVRDSLWRGVSWRRLWMDQGILREDR